MRSHSRGAFFVRARAMTRRTARPSPHVDLRQSLSGVERPKGITIGRGTEERERKRKQNAERRCFTNLRTCVRRCPLPHPPFGEGTGGGSTPSGVPRRLLPGRQLVPKALLQARLPGTRQERSIRKARSNRGAKTNRRDMGVTHARLSQSSESTSHTGRNAGRHDAQSRPGAEVTSQDPRAPHLAPPAGVTGGRPCKGARCAVLVRRVARDQSNSAERSHLSDLTRIFLPLFV